VRSLAHNGLRILTSWEVAIIPSQVDDLAWIWYVYVNLVRWNVLTLEALKEVREAEQNADKIIDQAKREAENILQRTRDEVAKNKKEAEEKVKEAAESLLNLAKREIEGERKKSREEGEKEKEQLLKKGNRRMSKAIRIIVDRIMKEEGV